MFVACPKCKTENPATSWFCSGCGASLKIQNQTPSQNPTFKIESLNTEKKENQVKVEQISGTNFNYLLNYAITLNLLANIILALSIIGAIAGIWISIKVGWVGVGIIFTSLIIGIVQHYFLKVVSEMAEALTDLDVYTRQTLEYLYVDHKLLLNLVKDQENKGN